MSTDMDVISVGNIDIEVFRKNIKNIYLRVYPPDGKVCLSVPYRIDEVYARAFVTSKLSWIEKQKKKYKTQGSEIKSKYISGETHYFFGSKYILNVVEISGKQHVELRDDKYIDLFIRPGSTTDKREKVMREWYRHNLKKIIADYIEKWEKIIGVTVSEWGVKLMKTRWGSCNIRDKRIWINLELAKKDLKCLDYIIVHEMVHLLERSHNEVFKDYMSKFLPDWKNIKDELNAKLIDTQPIEG